MNNITTFSHSNTCCCSIVCSCLTSNLKQLNTYCLILDISVWKHTCPLWHFWQGSIVSCQTSCAHTENDDFVDIAALAASFCQPSLLTTCQASDYKTNTKLKIKCNTSKHKTVPVHKNASMLDKIEEKKTFWTPASFYLSYSVDDVSYTYWQKFEWCSLNFALVMASVIEMRCCTACSMVYYMNIQHITSRSCIACCYTSQC